MKVLVTGANGFIGKNLVVHLNERDDVEVLTFTRDDTLSDLLKLVSEVEFIFHLAGVNRPTNVHEFDTGNADLTRALCEAVVGSGRQIPLIYSSSSQADINNAYGNSKLAAEEALIRLQREYGARVHIFRLPNVFGKWAKPYYNSVVATFCNNITKKIPVEVNDKRANLRLVYIDDVVDHFIGLMDGGESQDEFEMVEPEYSISVGDLAEQLYAFRNSRDSLFTEKVGVGLVRALYSTYVSYFSPDQFSYEVPKYHDQRGEFVEMLKTNDSGQFSFFTAYPGITRGGHYHHSKTEKFLVIRGKANFRFCHILTGESYELATHGDSPRIVETVPGWSHDITNVGDVEMIVMLWANEVFDRDQPDTYVKIVVDEA